MTFWRNIDNIRVNPKTINEQRRHQVEVRWWGVQDASAKQVGGNEPASAGASPPWPLELIRARTMAVRTQNEYYNALYSTVLYFTVLYCTVHCIQNPFLIHYRGLISNSFLIHPWSQMFAAYMSPAPNVVPRSPTLKPWGRVTSGQLGWPLRKI